VKDFVVETSVLKLEFHGVNGQQWLTPVGTCVSLEEAATSTTEVSLRKERISQWIGLELSKNLSWPSQLTQGGEEALQHSNTDFSKPPFGQLVLAHLWAE